MAIDGAEHLALTHHALAGFVRIATNRRAFAIPTPRATAFAVCTELLGHPNIIVAAPGPAFWTLFAGVCDEANLMGPDISDAYLAALAIEHSLEFVTTDRGFRRFSGLRLTVLG